MNELIKICDIERMNLINDGSVSVYLSENKLCVKSTVDGGILIWMNKEYPIERNKEIVLEFKQI